MNALLYQGSAYSYASSHCNVIQYVGPTINVAMNYVSQFHLPAMKYATFVSFDNYLIHSLTKDDCVEFSKQGKNDGETKKLNDDCQKMAATWKKK